MRSHRAVLTIGTLILTIGLSGGCAAVDEVAHESIPAISIVDGPTDGAPKTLTLTADAARRLELNTVVVNDPAALPYASVVYDKKGKPWVYTQAAEHTFVRVPITVERIEGESAVVSTGPASGTRVVTRAAIKLYGAENGVGGGR